MPPPACQRTVYIALLIHVSPISNESGFGYLNLISCLSVFYCAPKKERKRWLADDEMRPNAHLQNDAIKTSRRSTFIKYFFLSSRVVSAARAMINHNNWGEINLQVILGFSYKLSRRSSSRLPWSIKDTEFFNCPNLCILSIRLAHLFPWSAPIILIML